MHYLCQPGRHQNEKIFPILGPFSHPHHHTRWEIEPRLQTWVIFVLPEQKSQDTAPNQSPMAPPGLAQTGKILVPQCCHQFGCPAHLSLSLSPEPWFSSVQMFLLPWLEEIKEFFIGSALSCNCFRSRARTQEPGEFPSKIIWDSNNWTQGVCEGQSLAKYKLKSRVSQSGWHGPQRG